MTDGLPPELRERWTRAGSREDRIEVALWTIETETTVYDHRETPHLDGSTIQPRALLSIELTLSPPLSLIGISPSKAFSIARGAARDRFVSMLEAEGIEVRGQRKQVAFDRGDGEAGRWFVFETTQQAAEVQIETETHVAVWPTATSFRMAGGTVPLESPVSTGMSDASQSEKPTEENQFVVDPETDRERIATFVRHVARKSLEGP